MLTMKQAQAKIEEKYPDFEVTASFDYKDQYVFVIFPKDFDFKRDKGFVDNYYCVDKKSGVVDGFAPWAEPDFFAFLRKQQKGE